MSFDGKTLVLRIEGIGPCPAFKNTKAISLNRKTGKRFLRTDPKKKAWMEKAASALASQLLLAYQTDANAISTGCSLPCWIACNLPRNDSWHCIPMISIRGEAVPKGQEGVTIELTRL